MEQKVGSQPSTPSGASNKYSLKEMLKFLNNKFPFQSKKAKIQPVSEPAHSELSEEEQQRRMSQIENENIMEWSYLRQKALQSEHGTCSTQMVRSASHWTLGLKSNSYEESIHIAYLQLISEAKYYIYIENQFFISGLAGAPVKNLIAEALVKRIQKAASAKEKFKVIVFMPLLPGFAGEVTASDSGVMKVQLHWEYQTICRGQNSILNQLESDPNIKNPFDYIQFYGLRQHGILNNKPVTEIIYIHSKLLIVDDKIALIGSANINDRSLIGSRDSEIAMIIEDTQKIQTLMNETTYNASQFAYTLRTALYCEHFGFTPNEVEDPLSEDLESKIFQLTEVNKFLYQSYFPQRNTLLYREIFYCYPDDTLRSLADIEANTQTFMPDLDTYLEKSTGIQGHAVQLPLHFLEKERLTFKVFNKEYLVPDISFT